MSLPAFEQVVSEHGHAVLQVCRVLLGHHDAEDAWSETFLAALAAYPRLRPESNIRGWLVTIAQRKAIDRIRAQSRITVPLDQVPEPPAPSIEEGAADRELWDAIAALPLKQRGAIAYHYLADLPYVQVAELLDSSEAAARRAAADGMASLRASLIQEVRT